ncbi:MAG: Leucyl/phenylalanyl-tRNA--protein transferase (EC [uncultured Thiotrichaceae bacterium]|uniref:Leucyl/phenylalanyl-tRNA--protein transferase n=1 Tax=uncultured Thiotrichaceae bacterium TaxID=298394 RepID=A0A6S6TVN8_9GAMM|nr:MAG: Leucyl/phenylalanyl-tRNA--protein transferase (EC [uncultured Thiotrichaceae bacterium]
MSGVNLTLLDPNASDEPFPPVEMAWDEPNGLLAVGGDLSSQRLLNAYNSGVFPWFNENEPYYWWSPNPRAVIYPHEIRISRSLRKSIRNKGYRLSFDEDFSATMKCCAAPRDYGGGTWITDEMLDAYSQLHKMGHAHSVEIRSANDELIGGLYGVAVRGVFCGESMFSFATDTSKMAFVGLAAHLQQWGYQLIDCQIENPHLLSLGAHPMPRDEYLKTLKQSPIPKFHQWKADTSLDLSHWIPEKPRS